jgi:restriction system protein
MGIPDFQTLMLPLLRSLSDGSPRSTQPTIDAVAADLGLSEAEVREPMPSAKSPLFTTGWRGPSCI